MTYRQSVLKAFNFQEVRPVPYTVWYDDHIARKLNEYYGHQQWDEGIHKYILRLMVEWEPKTYTIPGCYRDVHGTEWQEGLPAHIVVPALKEPSLQGYQIPSYLPYLKNPQEERLGLSGGIVPSLPFDRVRSRIASEHEEVFTVVGYGPGILERGWMIRGFKAFFMDLILEPAFVEHLLDLILERQLELLDALVELPIDAIIFADDWGDQRGVMIGPQLWRKFVKPRTKILYDKVHSAGKIAIQHTCGNVFEIIPDMIDIGLDCLQSLQPEAMPVYEIKKHYGKNLCLWGGLGTQQLLPFGTPEAIREEVRNLKTYMGQGGGYVLSSTKPIMSEVPVENAVALIEETIRD